MKATELLSRTSTIIFVALVVAGIVIFDVYQAFGNKEPDDTISDVLQGWALGTPFVAWTWGVLAGHLFLFRAAPLLERLNIIVLLALTLVVASSGFLTANLRVIWVQAAMLVGGALAGYLLWPQELPP